MNRREFLVAAGVAIAAPKRQRRGGGHNPESGRWREFEITTHVRVLEPHGATRVWLPTPLAIAPYQRTMGDNYHPGSGTAVMIETNASEPDMLGCVWDEDVEASVTLVSRVAIRDHAVPGAAGPGADKARAIFEGALDNELFVGECRAVGLRVRLVYGLRLTSADATRAQQARAEIVLDGQGWVPVDAAARQFGSWDTDWLAYNSATQVRLRGSDRAPLPYFMHPQGETGKGPLDSLDPERFSYSIRVQEIAPTADAPRPANWLL